MTAKEWLARYTKLQDKIEENYEVIIRISANATATTSAYGGTAVKSAGTARRAEESLVQIERRERVINRLIEEGRAINRAIDSIEDHTVHAALTYRYLCGYTVEKTAALMKRDPKTVRRLINKGLEQIRVPAEYQQAGSGWTLQGQSAAI